MSGGSLGLGRGNPGWVPSCRAVGASHLIQVHTLVNEHRHTVDDVVSSQPLVDVTEP